MSIHALQIARIVLPAMAAFGCIDSADVTLPEERQILSGSAEIAVSTTGENVDLDGYVVAIDESLSSRVDVNGTASFTLVPGNYQVTLSDVADNCAIQGSGSTLSFTVAAGGTAYIAYAVACI
jgi:hypothetical protein